MEAACGGEEVQSVRPLTLDGAVKCSQGRLPTRSLLERFTQLRVLSIANVGLTSLADFPSLPHLQRLILSDNRISGGLEFLVSSHLQSLRDLDLSNNKIQSFEELAPLAQLNLLSLDLYECPITRVEDYRRKVFLLIKSLQYLDKVDAEDNERPESDEEEEDHDDDGEDGEDDGVDDEEPAHTGDKALTSNGRVDQDDEEDEEDDGETSDELDEEDEENDLGVNHVEGTNDVSGSEEEVDDEEETEQVVEEVQDIDESEDEEEDDEEDGTEQASPEISEETDAQGEGEEDNSEVGDEDEEGDEGVEDEEEEEGRKKEKVMNTFYLILSCHLPSY